MSIPIVLQFSFSSLQSLEGIIPISSPIILGIIMFSMGMTLKTSDFKRITTLPKGIIIGLITQFILFPCIGWLVASNFHLEKGAALGIMIVTLCPGGAVSNLIAYFAKADVALSVSLTAIGSVLGVLILPFSLNICLYLINEESGVLHLDLFKTFSQIFLATIPPLVMGMVIKSQLSQYTTKLVRAFNFISIFAIIWLVLASLYLESYHIIALIQAILPAVLYLNIVTMLLGFGFAKSLNLNPPQSIAIGLEAGIQNTTLAIGIANGPFMLSNNLIAIPAALYGVVMLFTSSIIIYIARNHLKR